MTPGAFYASINEVETFLKQMGLFKSRGPKDIGVHSEEFRKISRKTSHRAIYNIAIQNLDYEFLLFDDSIFQFGQTNGVTRYAFIQNPQNYVSKVDYLMSIYGVDEYIKLSEQETLDLLNLVDEEEFEQYSNEQDLNLESNILRYDLDKTLYKPLLHAYSHVHIGLNENLRIPCSKELSPLKFTLFSVKQSYYPIWKQVFENDDKLEKELERVKRQCNPVEAAFWQAKEKFELFLD